MLMMSRKKNLNPQGDVILRNEAIQRVTKSKFLGVQTGFGAYEAESL